MHKIQTVDEIRTIKRSGRGFVIIVDHPNKTNRIHYATCPHVDERNFLKKVVVNNGENGQYHWAEDLSVAKQAFDTLDWCSVCRRTTGG